MDWLLAGQVVLATAVHAVPAELTSYPARQKQLFGTDPEFSGHPVFVSQAIASPTSTQPRLTCPARVSDSCTVEPSSHAAESVARIMSKKVLLVPK